MVRISDGDNRIFLKKLRVVVAKNQVGQKMTFTNYQVS
jgi:hypothetical protein